MLVSSTPKLLNKGIFPSGRWGFEAIDRGTVYTLFFLCFSPYHNIDSDQQYCRSNHTKSEKKKRRWERRNTNWAIEEGRWRVWSSHLSDSNSTLEGGTREKCKRRKLMQYWSIPPQIESIAKEYISHSNCNGNRKWLEDRDIQRALRI